MDALQRPNFYEMLFKLSSPPVGHTKSLVSSETFLLFHVISSLCNSLKSAVKFKPACRSIAAHSRTENH